LRSLVQGLASLALVLAGCGGAADPRIEQCTRYATWMVECGLGDAEHDLTNHRTVQWRTRYATNSCVAKLDRVDGMDRILSCAAPDKVDDCAAFEACREGVANAIDAERLAAWLEQGDGQSVQLLCDVRPALAVCRDAKLALVEELVTKTMPLLRDGKAPGSPSDVCLETKALVRSLNPVPPGTMARVQRACKEALAGQHLRDALAEVARYKREGLDVLPRLCRGTVSELRRIAGSVWAPEATKVIARACYQDLGAEVLDRRLAKARVCDPTLREIIGGVRSYKLESKRLKPLYRSALELCPVNPTPPGAGAASGRPGSGLTAPTGPGPGSSRPH